MNILLISYDEELKEQIQLLEYYDITTCTEAETILEFCQQIFYPLILVDLSLPGVNGVEICRRLRAAQQDDYSMVLVIASDDQAESVQTALDAGANDYLIQPINVNLLYTRLEILKRQFHYLAQHRQAEEALRERDQQLELAITGSNGGLWSVKFNPEQPSVIPDEMYLSPQLKQFIGFADHEFPNSLRAWQNHILPEDVQRVRENTQRALTLGIHLDEIEYRMRHKDGSIRWIQSRGKLQHDEQRNPVRWAGIAWDITEHKQMENVLAESEERFRSVVENATIGMSIQHIQEACVVAVNRSLCKMLEYTEEELLGKTLLHFTHPDDRDISLEYLQKLESEQYESITFDKRYLTKRGDIVHVISSIALVKDYNGNPKFIIEQIQDITARKNAEDALRKSAEQYRLLIENVADGVGIIQNNVLVFVNKAFCTILGRTYEELVGINPVELFHTQYKEQVKEVLAQSERGIFQQELEAICVTGDGRKIWIEERHSMIQWGEKSALILTIIDITEDKLRELANEEERNYLKTINLALKSTLKDRYRFGDIIGKSPVMQEVYKLILSAAASDANVVIYGESGTGKELIASTIHYLSKRKEKVFAPVNCGAITETLFESEFFGHCKGAFTGAHQDQAGIFDYAHGGTLFLDEVGELNGEMQVKLLRVLENGEYTPVGDHTVKDADVRIIAATNQNLESMVEQGTMREDFFFRLYVIAISLPPLRDRREDIPLLIEYFLERYSEGEIKPRLPGHIFEKLYNYDWPGNVREVQNVLQRYLTTKRLDFVDFGADKPENNTTVFSLEDIALKNLELYKAIEVFEKRFITEILNQNQRHRRKTAEILGLPVRTLYRKIKKYQIFSNDGDTDVTR
jgi:PAS domain S-box-containing protein